jgi:predicted metal-binding membrane protein
MWSDRIRAMGAAHWLVLFGVILGAWALLYAMALPADLRAAGAVYGTSFLESLCIVPPGAAGLPKLFLMWALMAAAMMAPTALPAFATYEDLGRAGGEVRFGALVAGYMAVWLGFAAVAATAQMALTSAGLVSPFGDSRSAGLTAGLLLFAGLYQFSSLKEACLSKCRQPLTFFMAHWDEGPWRNGLRLGAVCLGCCWALMALAFVGGVMNVAFMGLAALIMVLEKLPEIGRWVTRPLGVVLIAAAIWTGLSAV